MLRKPPRSLPPHPQPTPPHPSPLPQKTIRLYKKKPVIFYVECEKPEPDPALTDPALTEPVLGKPIYGEFRYSAKQEMSFTWAKTEAGVELWGIQLEGYEPFNPDVWTLCESSETNLVEIPLVPQGEHEPVTDR